jgi:hypothetical protein
MKLTAEEFAVKELDKEADFGNSDRSPKFHTCAARRNIQQKNIR